MKKPRPFWFRTTRSTRQGPPIAGQCNYVYKSGVRCSQPASKLHGDGVWCWAHRVLNPDGTRGAGPRRKKWNKARPKERTSRSIEKAKDQYDPDHWAYDMRRCPMAGCLGVVDDEVRPPMCCACGTVLPDGPGVMALPAPSGRKFQNEWRRNPPDRRPPNVVSLERCPFCGAREVETDMGPHRFVIMRKGRKWSDRLRYPAFHCLCCDQSWTDHRAETVRDAAARRGWEALGKV